MAGLDGNVSDGVTLSHDKVAEADLNRMITTDL